MVADVVLFYTHRFVHNEGKLNKAGKDMNEQRLVELLMNSKNPAAASEYALKLILELLAPPPALSDIKFVAPPAYSETT